MSTLLVMAVVLGVIAVPTIWVSWKERSAARAEAVSAMVGDAVNRALGGESLVEVHVDAARPWRGGRVILSVPADWSCLVEPVWRASLARLPRGWGLAVESGPAARLRSRVCGERAAAAA